MLSGGDDYKGSQYSVTSSSLARYGVNYKSTETTPPHQNRER